MIFRLLRALLSSAGVFTAATKPDEKAQLSTIDDKVTKFDQDHADKFHKGYFEPNFPEKYRGDSGNIFFRSSWERIACEWCDLNPRVIAWASEELDIQYFMKGVSYPRRYYPDLLIYFGRGQTMMIEIKPSGQKKNPNYENRCKWAAARAYCREQDWKFRIWDEETIKKLSLKVHYWRKKLY